MPKITLKRVTDTSGTTADLFPTTTVDQIFTIDGNGDPTSTTLDSHLTSTYIPLSQKGANSGVAELNSSGKVPVAQLPDEVFSGLTLVGTITTSSTPPTGLDIAHLIDGGANSAYSFTTLDSFASKSYTNGDYAGIGDRYIGHYWISNSSLGAVTLIDNSSSDEAEWNSAVFDDGVAPSGTSPNANFLSLESGDWIIITGWDETNDRFKISVVNNNTTSASASTKGVVQLSNATSVTGMSGNDVITEGVLAGLVGTASGDLAAGDHLHDGRYYTETEIGSFFSGGTSISGYNKTNWDTAYGWGDHASGGYQSATNSQSVSLTGAVTGTGTITNFGNLSIATTATSDPTLTLSGDASGSATFTNLGNATLAVTVANDSHTHDGRYYTETEFNNWLDGDTAIDGHNFTEILYGASPSSTNVGTILIDID